MSPRPRKVTDAQLFEAALAVMNQAGPRELTLAAIARQAGVTAAVLVQRFGSKRALLLELARQAATGAGGLIRDLGRRHDSPLAAIRAYADCMAGLAASPAAIARSLAYLQTDVTDPEFRRLLVRQSRATRAGLTRLAEAAQQAGELSAAVRPALLARTLDTVIGGSLLSWACYQQGSAPRWIRADVDAVLAPYATEATGRSGARAPAKFSGR